MDQKNIKLKNGLFEELEIENAIDKLQNIANELKHIFVERDDVIDNSIKALITGQTVLLIGPPGTAKSALTNALCNRIDNGRYFSWLLNRTSDPAEILGPFSIKEMENDKFIRVTKNKLPEAEIAFLDEIFKCNEPTLNILLPLINEKLFYNDGHPTDVPLITLFAASNEFPEEDSLMALYDRMIFRMHVNYIGDIQNKMTMFKSFLNKNNNNDQYTTISLDELKTLRSALDKVVIEDSVLKEYISLMNALLQDGIIVSDRRQNECLKVLRANALLNKKDKVDSSDFECLKDVLWNELEEIERIEEILRERSVSSYEKEYNFIKSRYNEIVLAIKNIKDTRTIVEVRGSVEYIYDKINRVLKESELMEDDIKDKFTTFKKEVKSQLDKLEKQIEEEGLDDMF
ncbi:ATPase, AAA family [Gottschalkia purinilytica]|uniref:ATPase, AAA family n=1 Tax=Gottschalkia purinilytica TaxID=1503 RepID=A0A0L0WF32_GOTPU|nr:AAA family ATPase [Gottschalkia purinilytica]KNF10097.1 ATPase, AAA family [Gottschalkia purinilytica]